MRRRSRLRLQVPLVEVALGEAAGAAAGAALVARGLYSVVEAAAAALRAAAAFSQGSKPRASAARFLRGSAARARIAEDLYDAVQISVRSPVQGGGVLAHAAQPRSELTMT